MVLSSRCLEGKIPQEAGLVTATGLQRGYFLGGMRAPGLEFGFRVRV